MRYIALTDKGKKTIVNQDIYKLPPETFLDNKQKYLFILCDGMGGHNAGNIASYYTAQWLFKEFYEENPQKYLRYWFLRKIKSINEKIYQMGLKNSAYYKMGTTLVAFLMDGNKGYVFSVGDSRLYLYSNRILTQITEDQSIVWTRYKSGQITKNQLIEQPDKNVILGAIGLPHPPEININTVKLKKDDVILMCSDGITDVLVDTEIKNLLGTPMNLKYKGEELLDAARLKGSIDDATIILIKK